MDVCNRTARDGGSIDRGGARKLDTLDRPGCLRANSLSGMVLLLPEVRSVNGTQAGLERTDSGHRVLQLIHWSLRARKPLTLSKSFSHLAGFGHRSPPRQQIRA